MNFNTLLKKGQAEFLATFFMVFIGTGSIVINDFYPNIGGFGISLCFGLAVWLGIFMFGKKSGAHMNPVISFMFFLKKDLNTKEFSVYAINQLLGAYLASFILKKIYPLHPTLGATLPQISIGYCFILELIMSAILGLSVFYFVHSKWVKFTPLVASSVVFILAFIGGPFTGASMNPARSIAPALVSGQILWLWIYVLAPILGASIAFYLWRFLIKKEETAL